MHYIVKTAIEIYFMEIAKLFLTVKDGFLIISKRLKLIMIVDAKNKNIFPIGIYDILFEDESSKNIFILCFILDKKTDMTDKKPKIDQNS